MNLNIYMMNEQLCHSGLCLILKQKMKSLNFQILKDIMKYMNVKSYNIGCSHNLSKKRNTRSVPVSYNNMYFNTAKY